MKTWSLIKSEESQTVTIYVFAYHVDHSNSLQHYGSDTQKYQSNACLLVKVPERILPKTGSVKVWGYYTNNNRE